MILAEDFNGLFDLHKNRLMHISYLISIKFVKQQNAF